MAIKTRKQLSDEISDLCDQAECNDKIRKLHSAQYVDRRWNPHPPRTFLSWWNKDGAEITEKATGNAWLGIDAIRAFNCHDARNQYRVSQGYAPDTAEAFYQNQ